jgi:4-hydroxy-2-oxoheptanedioate aldolase
MNGKQVVSALHSGSPVYGTLVTSPSPTLPPLLRPLGLDLVFIDTEHVPIDRAMLSWMCRAYDALELAPMVRIPEPAPCRASMVLDGGARGVLAPYVETPQQVRALVGAVKLRPLKGRRLDQFLAGEAPLEPELMAYLEECNAGNFLIVNVESTPAIEVLDEILSVPGLDALLIGPHDLSCSLGIPEQYDHPRFEEVVRRILKAARSHGAGGGVHFWREPERQIEWAKAGANLIMHHGDNSAFIQTLQRDIEMVRGALEDLRASAARIEAPV